uniref:Solute carrier family 1 member 3 n=1 Tax=Monodelphis domestica TaxID=13616 RepID=A0A5F8HKR8_MONDO
MTKSNGEEPQLRGRMERFQQGVRKRTLLAKKKVQSITKEDVKSYLFRNAFVLLTVTAVIVGPALHPGKEDEILPPPLPSCSQDPELRLVLMGL